MAEHMKGPKKAPHHKETHKKAPDKKKEGASDIRRACMYITKAVRAGVLGAAIATKAMAMMGCGARTGLPEDEMAFVDKDQDDGKVDAGQDGCMSIDAGHDGSMSVDAGGSKPGIDAGGSKGIDTDAGGSKPGIDAGGSKPGIDAGGSEGVDTDAGGSKPGPDGSMGA